MALLRRLLGRDDAATRWRPLYDAVVGCAREPRWYARGGVADTLDGRFDMVSTVLAFVLARLEAEGVAGRESSARVAELFIADMDGQLRQQGIGDIVVGKHVGKMMAALGGRLAAYRAALGPAGDLPAALDRNVHRAPDAAPEARAYLDREMAALFARIMASPIDAILAGRLPAEAA